MNGKHFVVPSKNSAQKDYPKESSQWVKDILTIQQVGPKDYNKDTHHFYCKDFQPCAS